MLNLPLDPKRPAFVLLHEDQSHIYSRPDGEPEWSHSKRQLEITRKIALEIGPCPYHICDLKKALVLIGEKQTELEKAWLPTIKAIRKEKSLNERLNIYRKKLRYSKVPHPLLYDTELKQLLKIN